MAKKAKDPQLARLEARAKKVNEELRHAKLCNKYGFPVFYPSKRQIHSDLKKKAKALPKETRQKVLDMYWAGGKTATEIAAECGVTLQQFCGVIMINTKTIKYTVLNTETV